MAQKTPPTPIGAGMQICTGSVQFKSATATAVMGVVAATVAGGNAGSGYTTPPAITFTGGGGTGAAATCVLSSDGVGTITITNAGSGYTTAPTMVFTGGGGSAAAAVVTLKVVSFTITNAGTYYSGAPTVTVTGNATSTATITAGLVTGLSVTGTNNAYTTPPTVTIAPPTQAKVPCPFSVVLGYAGKPLGTPAANQNVSISSPSLVNDCLTNTPGGQITLTRTGTVVDYQELYTLFGF